MCTDSLWKQDDRHDNSERQPSVLGTDLNSAVLANLRQQVFNRRDFIPLQPDYLWRIEQGAVRTITWAEDGSLITLGYWGLGDVIGKPLSRVSPYEVECLTSVEASILPSHLRHHVLDAEMQHMQQAEELLIIVHCKRAHLCLMQLLQWLAQRFGREVHQGKLINLPLTHQEIAETTGLTRVTITRLLNQFEREGMIRQCRGHLILLHH